MGYTKGPWVVDGEHGEYVSQQYEDEAGIAHVLCIDEDGDGWVRGDTTHANARLIAAAPCLLELLIEARATFEMWKDVAPAISLCADIDRAIARAKREAE